MMKNQAGRMWGCSGSSRLLAGFPISQGDESISFPNFLMNESVLARPDGQTGSTRSSWDQPHSQRRQKRASAWLCKAPVLPTGPRLTAALPGLGASITLVPPSPGPLRLLGTLKLQGHFRACGDAPGVLHPQPSALQCATAAAGVFSEHNFSSSLLMVAVGSTAQLC